MKNTIKAIAALIISATMISITACGNTDTTSSAPPKATTTASSTEASATTTTEATLTSQSEETTSLSATTTGTSASTKAQAVLNLRLLQRTLQKRTALRQATAEQ